MLSLPNGRRVSGDDLAILAIAAAKVLLNLAFLGRYDYFRDELYYLACADHLDWGYVDQPPLSIAILALTRAVAGDSLVAIRLPAVLAGALVVVLTGWTARRLGGGRTAQVLAALAAALSPVVLGNAGRTFSMNAFDLLFWAWAAYLAVTLLQQDRPRLWLAFGAVAGLGLLNKYSMLFLGFGLVVGLLVTRARRQLATRWPWLGLLVALALFLPHLLWEAAHGWPSLEFMHVASQEKNVRLPLGTFLWSQVEMEGLGQALLWTAGLAWFAFAPSARALRPFAWLYPAVLAVMVLNGSKAYYLTPIYAPYVAAGAVWLESCTAAGRRRLLRPVFAGTMVVLSALVFPFAIPCLSVEGFVRYADLLGVTPRAEERHSLGDLPQYYADQFGWRELAAQVQTIWRGLAPEDRAHCVIYLRNYGEAAAVDFFCRDPGFPRAISSHNSYWLWSSGDPEMRVAIVVGGEADEQANRADLEGPGRFGHAELAAVTSCEHCMPFERGRQLWLCREPHFRFADIWDGERFFY